jgi:hypothetical protein
MVTSARTPLRVDRLRALNVPRQVTVELDGREVPEIIVPQPSSGTTGDGGRRQSKQDDEQPTPGASPGSRRWRVESIGEIWRVDDEWWRQPISRRYVELVLEGGKHVVLFEDLTTGQWWMQQP